MHTLGKPELSENRTIRPVPKPSGLQRVYCMCNASVTNNPVAGRCVRSPGIGKTLRSRPMNDTV
ncbi:hypothetical protein DPMN_166287 [Dreissena polymorpha]|uniref:Uncharacterized protein n=1 Tax=Dreissena polymorpha TaxID=45954 RepID=A0A9D4EWU2_DREPO|nr:hypothetical protein DPMN_166287 [Dreissena polymorpha]